MVSEQGHDRNAEHPTHKEKEQNMKPKISEDY